MNTAPVRAARIVDGDDGVPRSADYGDAYHPRIGALAQARHVFLDGDALAARWRGRDRFVVLETGFGLGSNFLATRAAWRADPDRCRQLHFISIESAPPARDDLAALDRDPALAPFAAELAACWPPLTWNLHRRTFDDGGVELLLAFGTVEAWLPQLTASVDAFFLDGFAPARNPAMWDGRVFKALARLAAPAATVATWSAARTVREGLRSAGFAVGNAPGIGGKRDITRACFAPAYTPRPSPQRFASMARLARAARADAPDVVIVGAGLAGCALAAALAERGRRSLVVERGDTIAGEGSGNAAGIFHGVIHRSDGRHARFARAAALAAHDAVRRAIAAGVPGGVDGLLRLETALDRNAIQAILDGLGVGADHVEALDAAAASRCAGVRIDRPAWFHPQGGWVDPRALCAHWLACARTHATLQLHSPVASLHRDGDAWHAIAADGTTLAAAPVLALCNGGAALDLLGRPPWPVRRQRGQISALPAAALASPLRLPLAGAGYVLPPIDGTVWFGASAEWDEGDDGAVRDRDQHDNVARLVALLGLPSPPSEDTISGRVGWRWVSGDRLPLIGAVPAADCAEALGHGLDAASPRLDQPRFIARAPGLFVCTALGSRGIASASLGGQLLAAAIAGAPLPVEADLLDAVDPGRFLSRRFRRDGGLGRRGAPTTGQLPVGPIAGSAGA